MVTMRMTILYTVVSGVAMSSRRTIPIALPAVSLTSLNVIHDTGDGLDVRLQMSSEEELR